MLNSNTSGICAFTSRNGFNLHLGFEYPEFSFLIPGTILIYISPLFELQQMTSFADLTNIQVT